MKKRYHFSAVQCKMISGQQNQRVFKVPRIGEVYYNYRGVGQASKVLRNSCIEWFIRCPNGRRIVFDTKYKEWAGRDNLTVLGYMLDFDAVMGAVAFPKNLPTNRYNKASISNEAFISVKTGAGRRFCALRLTPNGFFHADNELSMEFLLNELLHVASSGKGFTFLLKR